METIFVPFKTSQQIITIHEKNFNSIETNEDIENVFSFFELILEHLKKRKE